MLKLTDEFRTTSLDLRKWFPYSPFSFGTKPGLFVPSNVSVSDQKAWLTPKREALPDDAPEGYEGWTTGALVSRKLTDTSSKQRICQECTVPGPVE